MSWLIRSELNIVVAFLLVTGLRAVISAADGVGQSAKTFTFTVYGEKTIRENPTTQVAIRVKE